MLVTNKPKIQHQVNGEHLCMFIKYTGWVNKKSCLVFLPFNFQKKSLADVFRAVWVTKKNLKCLKIDKKNTIYENFMGKKPFFVTHPVSDLSSFKRANQIGTRILPIVWSRYLQCALLIWGLFHFSYFAFCSLNPWIPQRIPSRLHYLINFLYFFSQISDIWNSWYLIFVT